MNRFVPCLLLLALLDSNGASAGIINFDFIGDSPTDTVIDIYVSGSYTGRPQGLPDGVTGANFQFTTFQLHGDANFPNSFGAKFPVTGDILVSDTVSGGITRISTIGLSSFFGIGTTREDIQLIVPVNLPDPSTYNFSGHGTINLGLARLQYGDFDIGQEYLYETSNSFLIFSIPEPSSMFLIVIGISALGISIVVRNVRKQTHRIQTALTP